MKVAITGSSGMIGTALAASLRADGHGVVRLVRRSPQSAEEVRWDPQAADGAIDPDKLAGIDACVNLAGVGVGDRRWTASYKAQIRSSRVPGTRALAGVLAKLRPPPATLVSASAVGWYGDTGARQVDESGPPGTSFLAGVCRDWEAAAESAANAGIRVVHPRSGLVLSSRGGLLHQLLPVARLGVLPRLGPGTQVMSWISLSDEVAAIRFLLDHGELSGPVNLTSPDPVTNSAFTAALDHVLHRANLPWLRTPAWLMRAALGEGIGELLINARVTPKRLQQAGYQFRSPMLPEALSAELAC
ncbi:MAG TPA: TIGR01777 family oxidoreductase [Streptosporangiaceae bacterium]|nr:TIGR01777 family oxidoreductase [Streptosporangiaceae bacterium]